VASIVFICLKNGTCGLSNLVLGIDGWVQREWFTRAAAIGSPPVQHSLRKETRGPRRKQAEMGAAQTSRDTKGGQ